ncbi:MAG: hypothetical protein ACYC28_03560 [Longimicrobiales bacterium]
MRRSRVIAVATVAVLAACAGNWFDRLERAVPCTRSRQAVNMQVGPAGGRVDAGYAWVEFDANTFRDSARVVIAPVPGLHGIRLTLPSQNEIPAFDVGFPVDYCGDRPDDDDYYIVTEDTVMPARVVNGVAQRRVGAGEMSPELRDAAIVPMPQPRRSGFVILSN